MTAQSRGWRHLAAVARLPGVLLGQRFLLRQLAGRAFSARYAGSYLGWLWTPLATIVQFTLYLLVFSTILEFKSQALGIDLARRSPVGFGVFLVTGMVPFFAFNDSVMRAARVFRSHATLMQRMRLPAEVLVVGDMLGALIHHLVSLAVVGAYCVWRGHMIWSDLGWLALAVTLLALWILGIGLVVAIIGAVLPDLPEVLGIGLQVAFFGAPIVYPLTALHDGLLKTLVLLNPVTSLVTVWRVALIGVPPPSLAAIIAIAGGGLALVAIGAAALDRWRFTIPDML